MVTEVNLGAVPEQKAAIHTHNSRRLSPLLYPLVVPTAPPSMFTCYERWLLKQTCQGIGRLGTGYCLTCLACPKRPADP